MTCRPERYRELQRRDERERLEHFVHGIKSTNICNAILYGNAKPIPTGHA